MSEHIPWATEVVDVMGLGCRCKVVDGGSVMSLCWVKVAWISNEKKFKKTYLGPKDVSEHIVWATELVDVMGLGCCCKVVDGGSIISPWVEVAWASNEEKKKKLRKLTLGPKTCQNASFGPWKWWMWWVWVIVAKWWMVVVSCHLKLRWLGLATKKRNFFKKTYLRPKDMPECIIWAMEVVNVMGLGCCCKVVDGGSIMSLHWVETWGGLD